MNNLAKRLLVNAAIATFLIVAWPGTAQNSSDRMPYGPLGEVEIDQLIKFGRARGFDLQPELERVYKKDEEALARLFSLSLRFKKFDRNARAYGQVVYSCFVKFSDIDSTDLYLKILDRQPLDIQQRVRDLLFIRYCASQRKNARKAGKRSLECIRGSFRRISSLATTIQSSEGVNRSDAMTRYASVNRASKFPHFPEPMQSAANLR